MGAVHEGAGMRVVRRHEMVDQPVFAAQGVAVVVPVDRHRKRVGREGALVGGGVGGH